VTGLKTPKEKFPGALNTRSCEALMGDGKALQMGTSHNLGQKFAKMFGIQFLDINNQQQFVWQTSWGVSTRLVGALVLAHGDEKGLRLPPAIAPFQVVIVPIWRKKDEDARLKVEEAVKQLETELRAAGIRVKSDWRDNLSPGFKFNDWELRGVPLRIELGPRDIEQGSVIVARRDTGEKVTMSREGVAEKLVGLLADVQKTLLDQCAAFRESHTTTVSTQDEFRKVLEEKGGFVRCHWAGDTDLEIKIQDETKATIRAFPDHEPPTEGKCLFTGKPTNQIVYFAKAY